VSWSRDPAGTFHFNSPSDVTIPERRFGGANSDYKTNALTNNADLLINDVISFDVRLMVRTASGYSGFEDLFTTGTFDAYSSDNSSFNDAIEPRVFDTWSKKVENVGNYNYSDWHRDSPNTAHRIPLYGPDASPINVRAIQVIIRVWDVKTQQTRQVTLIQDL
jgi:hypothetical protein